MEQTLVYNKKEIRSKIYKMILPITIESMLQMTAGFVSMALIGRLDNPIVAAGAIGLGTRITQLIWALIKGVTTGASVFVAQAYGAGNIKKLKKVIQQTLLSTIILVIFLQQLVYWKGDLFLKFFKAPEGIFASASAYLKMVSWGLPFMAIMLIVAGVLQGMGNAKTPMLIALIMNFANVVFSGIFLFGLFGVPAMGIRGAALGLVLAQALGAVIGLYVLFNSSGILGKLLNRSFFHIDAKEIGSIYRVGIPSALESICWQVAAIILTKIILSFGEIPLAAHQYGLQAESISYMPAVGFTVAATAFIGQALGAKDKDLARIYLREIMKGSLIVTAFTGGVLILFPQFILGLLTPNGDVIKLGAIYLVIMGVVQFPQNISGVLNGALRGAGYTKIPMYIAMTGLWGIRVVFSAFVAYNFNSTIVMLWMIMGIDLVVRCILSIIMYKTKNIYNSNSLIIEEIQG